MRHSFKLRTTFLLVAGAMLALTIGCSSGGGEDSQASTKRDTPSTSVPSNASPSTTAMSKAPEPSPAPRAATLSPAELATGPNLENSGPSGAGCSPGNGSTLADGWWAGSPTKVEGRTIEFDVICFFAESAALQAASEDGLPAEALTHPYYTRNSNPKTYSVTFASETGPATLAAAEMNEANKGTLPATIGDALRLYGEGPNEDGRFLTANGEIQYQDDMWLHMSGGVADYVYMQWSC